MKQVFRVLPLLVVLSIPVSAQVTLVVNNDGNGSTTPSGTTTISSGTSYSLSATPNTNYRFDRWHIESGSPTIADTLSASTTISATSASSIKAYFKPCSVYTITSSAVQYNYTQNYYSGTAASGVRFKFTAPATGSYSVTIQNTTTYFMRLYYYGQDSQFSSYITTDYDYSSVTIAFNANAGENHYFKVSTTSSYYKYNFSISYPKALSLTITNDGNGRTSPSGDAAIFSGVATSISAVPAGGYLFQNWTVVRGNPVIADLTAAFTTVTTSIDSCAIQANFQINPNTQPNTKITDITISSHPDICITASVTDSAGRSISGLDSSYFVLQQDNDTVDFQITTISQIAGVSITLVIDKSTSMLSNNKFTEAVNSALEFIRNMDPLDRCAIVSFGNGAWLEQSMTSDTTQLNSAINNLVANSGSTKILTGTVMGIGQLLQETNSRTVIVFSDGSNSSSDIAMSTAVDSARNNNVTVYSIGIGTSADKTVLGAIADSTGGYYTASPTAAGLADLYAQIKSDVQSQYILCYRSPDVIFNGDIHEVVLSVSLNNHTARDTTYWNENNTPPQITLTSQTSSMIGVSQSPGQPLTISANVTDDGSVSLVRLFYRQSNIVSGSYTEVVMTNSSGTLYEYTIPANLALHPGIDFYILATDNYNLIGRSPNVLAPETQPWVIPIDNDVPVITQTPLPCLPQGVSTALSAVITDNDGTFIALLYYKKGNETFYTIDTMQETSTNNYSATIPGSMITADGIDYYFRAIDNVGAAVRNPASSSVHLDLCTATNPVADAGPDQTLYADNTSCSVNATLDGTGSSVAPLTYSWTGPFSGTLTGATPSVILPVGTNQVILEVTNGSGLSDLDTVIITVLDTFAPVPDQAVLPDISGQCSASASAPTATDNCGGIITGVTTDPTMYDAQGTYTITWNYTDLSGNSSAQTQTVIIHDTEAPVPLLASLDTLRDQCSVIITAYPQASDNCSGTLTATTTSPLSYDQEGEYNITWNYDDLHGNTATQIQTVIIDDNKAPVPEVPDLPQLYSSCSIELTLPYANDNCSGRIAATTTSPLILDQQGIYTVTWTYDDGHGNIATQDQHVTIQDTIAPVFNAVSDTTINTKSTVHSVFVHIDSATAVENCTPVTIQGVRSDAVRLDTLFPEGITSITWTACDTNNNCSTASQTVTVIRNRAPALEIPADTSLLEGEIISLSMFASDTDGTIPSLFIDSLAFPFVFTDSGNGIATLSLIPGCTDHGTYTINVHASDGIDTTTKAFTVQIDDINYPPEFDTASYFVAHELIEFSTLIKVYDCDDPDPTIRIINAPQGAQFVDNNNGTGTFIWTPDENDNGFYMVIFEAQDDMTTVRDTIIIEITDVNAFPPVLTLSTIDTTVPVNLPLVVYATATDADETPTTLRASGLPSGAQFESDNIGNAILRWTPVDTGIFAITVSAIDGADTTVKVEKQLTIRVSGINVTGPVFTSVNDVIIDQNQQMSVILEARDPDGTIPMINLKNGYPSGISFTDNGDGTASISWIPPCDISGVFYLTAFASDQDFTDSITFAVTVRDINCPPVLFGISDVNALPGEMVRIPVRAYDPDGDSIIPTLSVSCILPGHTFTTANNGSAVFRWQAIYDEGSYPVTFFASDGMLMDSLTMYININKTGYVHISSSPTGSNIYVMPNEFHSGEYLGIDSTTFSAAPGIYQIEVRKQGYRSEQFTVRVYADSSTTTTCTLKPSIPLMTVLLDTSFISQDNSSPSIPCTFADLNRDGYLDYTVLSTDSVKVYYGLDSTGMKFSATPFDLTDSLPVSQIIHYGFVDWNNDKVLDCIYSDLSGNIVVANFRAGTYETVLSLPGSKSFVTVLDINTDNNKDFVIHQEGYGIYSYINQGTDNQPVFSASQQIAITSGQLPASLSGQPTFIDIDGDGSLELLILCNHTPALFRMASDFSEMSYSDDLNCGGKRVISDSLSIKLIGSPFNMPYIILKTPAKCQLFNTHLSGDVNNDGKVDIRDISKISKLWEITESDPAWDPQCNLRLSVSGEENIDIRDISNASKSWELQQ